MNEQDDRIDELEGALERERGEHFNERGLCGGCGYEWPCPSSREIDEILDENK